MKILLVEDDQSFGRAFKAFLSDKGHDVTWLTAVESLDPFQGKDGIGSDITVEVSDFDIALTDGQLTGSAFQGVDVVKQLHAQGLTVLGISSQQDANDEMVSLGAIAAANKAVAFVALFCDMMKLEDIACDAVAAKSIVRQCDIEVRKNVDERHRAEAFLLSL